MPVSNDFANRVLNLSVGNVPYTPGTLNAVLCTQEPSKTSTPATLVRPSYATYADIVTTAADWTDATVGNPAEMPNAQELTWAQSAEDNGETVRYVAVVDVTANIVTYYGEITNPPGGLPIVVGTQPKFAVAAITLSETSI